MRTTFISLFFFLLYFPVKSQNGFIQLYDFEETGFGIHNMLIIENDTIVLCGTITNPDTNQWGLYFAKADTLGNIIDSKEYFDTLGDGFNFQQNADFIRTSDGGYAAVGQMKVRRDGFMIKMDAKGDLEFFREYPDEIAMTEYHTGLLEFAHGYLSYGRKQQPTDALTHGYIRRLNFQGEIIWELNLDQTDYDIYFENIVKLNNNEFLCVGPKGGTDGNGPEDRYNIPVVLKFDSLGNVLSFNQGDTFYFNVEDSDAIYNVKNNQGGEWVGKGVRGEPWDNPNGGEINWKTQLQILKSSENFDEIIWRVNLGGFGSAYNTTTDVNPSADGHWLATGQFTVSSTVDEETGEVLQKGYHSGYTAKISDEGELMWMRTDTVYQTFTNPTRHFLSATGSLSSGSVVSVGYINRFDPTPVKTLGWLIKTDLHGCFEEGCNPLTSGVNFTDILDGFSVFPNPTADYLQVTGEGEFAVEVFDAFGKRVLIRKENTESSLLDLSGLTPGIYFAKISQGYKAVTKRVSVVR